jgi:hypothetical protein
MTAWKRFLSALFPSASSEKAPESSDPREAGRKLRTQFLDTQAEALGLQPTPEFPRVFGVVMDWPTGEQTASLASLCDGSASLYTTTAFGIIGGGGNERVRAAARRFVELANAFLDEATPASEWPYPSSSEVHFYLRGYDGVRCIREDAEPIYARKSKYTELFGAGQDVLTELRNTSERKG